jgi:hypothetical protein
VKEILSLVSETKRAERHKVYILISWTLWWKSVELKIKPNQATCQEDTTARGGGGTGAAAYPLSSLTPRPLCLQAKGSWWVTHLLSDSVGPETVRVLSRREILCSCRDSNPESPASRPNHGRISILFQPSWQSCQCIRRGYRA